MNGRTTYFHCVVHDFGIPPSVPVFNKCMNDLRNTGLDHLIRLYREEYTNKIIKDKMMQIINRTVDNESIMTSFQVDENEFVVGTEYVYMTNACLKKVVKKMNERELPNIQPLAETYMYMNMPCLSWNTNYNRVIAELKGLLTPRQPIIDETELEQELIIEDEYTTSEEEAYDDDDEVESNPFDLTLRGERVRQNQPLLRDFRTNQRNTTGLAEYLIYNPVDLLQYEKSILEMKETKEMKEKMIKMVRKVSSTRQVWITKAELVDYLVHLKRILLYYCQFPRKVLAGTQYVILCSVQVLVKLLRDKDRVHCSENMHRLVTIMKMQQTCFTVLDHYQKPLFGKPSSNHDDIDYRYSLCYLCVLLTSECVHGDYQGFCQKYFAEQNDEHTGYSLFWTLFRQYKRFLFMAVRIEQVNDHTNAQAIQEICGCFLSCIASVLEQHISIIEEQSYQSIYIDHVSGWLGTLGKWARLMLMGDEQFGRLKKNKAKIDPLDTACPALINMIKYHDDYTDMVTVFGIISKLYSVLRNRVEFAAVIAVMITQISKRNSDYLQQVVMAIENMQKIYIDATGWGVFMCGERVGGALDFAHDSKMISIIKNELLEYAQSPEDEDNFIKTATAVLQLSCTFVQVRNEVRTVIFGDSKFVVMRNDFEAAVRDYDKIKEFANTWVSSLHAELSEMEINDDQSSEVL
jgi:hypothetical protein